MLTIIPVCRKDAGQALKLAGWIRELGGVMAHSCVLAISKAAHEEGLSEPILEQLRLAFHKVDLYQVSDIDEPAWPKGANHAFIRVCKDVIQNDPVKPFLWLEPDAIPLKATWLDQIEREYMACGKPFMGAFVDLPGTKKHMSGIAVYRQVDRFAPSYVLSHEFAFDIVMADEVIPKAHFTSLIQHDWKPAEGEIQSRVSTGAVVYHQDKTGVLIDALRGGGCSTEKPAEGADVVAVLHGIPATLSTPKPVEKELTIPQEIRNLTFRLREISEINPSRRTQVLVALKENGLQKKRGPVKV
tara:strand:- start:1686 stop:2585 length:900 start_codon:yes stop_codon:yes gene_type:complete